MGIKSQVGQLTYPDVTDSAEFQEDVPPEPENIAIANILASLGGDSDAVVTIMREGPGGYRDQEYLTECAPSEFSVALLQHEFGGGKFRIHIREKGKLVANRPLKVATLRGAPRDSMVAPQIQNEIKELAGIVAKLADVVARGTQAPVKTTTDLLTELKLMKEVIGTQKVTESDPFESMTKVFELAKTISGMAGGGDVRPDGMSVMMKALENFGPILAQANAAKMMQPQIENAGMMGAPAMTHQPDYQLEGIQQNATVQAQNQEVEMLKFYLENLRKKAEGNSDPEIYANLIVDNLDDEQINALLKPDDWWERLCQFDPKLVQFREWFSEMRRIIFEILTEEEEEATSEKSTPTTNPVMEKTNATKGTAKARIKGDS